MHQDLPTMVMRTHLVLCSYLPQCASTGEGLGWEGGSRLMQQKSLLNFPIKYLECFNFLKGRYLSIESDGVLKYRTD